MNRAIRAALRPFAPYIPERFYFPVTGEITVVLPEGERIRLACNPTSFVAKELFWKGWRGFEGDLVGVFIGLAKQSVIFFDVGANIGYYSLVAAAVNPLLRIVSFEPMPGAYRYLEQNAQLNGFGRIHTEALALSDTSGTATFYLPANPKFADIEDQLIGGGGLNRMHSTSSSRLKRTLAVLTETMDRYVEANVDGRVDLVKLDTEATEHLILAGAERVLRDHRPVILCEVLPGRIEHELERCFAAHDYTLFRAESGGLLPVDRLTSDATVSHDHVMVPREATDRVASFLLP